MNDSFCRAVGQFLLHQQSKEDRAKLAQRVIVTLGIICAIALVLAAANAHADPRFQVSTGDIRVVLHDEPCALKDQITNLPYRAVWHEKGQVFEGCWGARPDEGVVLSYFSDKTVGLIPMGALTPVRGA